MRYLVTGKGMESFYTNWFDIDNNYCSGFEMVVYNLLSHEYYDGNPEKKWKPVNQDHL